MAVHDLEQEEQAAPRLLRLEQMLAAAAMGMLGLITFANVVVRYLTDFSFAFTEEFSIALMVIVTMLGTCIAAATNRHISITFLVDVLPPRQQRWAGIVAGLATVAMFTIFVGLGAWLAYDEYRFEVTSPALGLPQWLYTAMLPLFSLVVVLRAVGHVIRVVKRDAPSLNSSATDPV